MFFLSDEMTGQATAFDSRDGLTAAMEELFGPNIKIDQRVPVLVTMFEAGEDISAFEAHMKIKITEL